MIRALPILVIALLGAVALAQSGWFSKAPSHRELSYQVSGPLGAPIIYATSFNGARLEPVATRTVYHVHPTSFGGGSVHGSIPVVDQDKDRLVIHAQWLEYNSGEAYEATIEASVPDDIRIVVEFLTDGAMSLFIPSERLRQGGLGRIAVRDDYTLVAHTCGTPLAADTAAFPALKNARANGYGINPIHFEGGHFPTPPPNACSARLPEAAR